MKEFRKVRECIISSLPFLALLISVVTYSFWFFIKQKYDVNIFFIGNILAVNCLTFYIYLIDNNYSSKINLFKLFLCEITLMNLFKEIFFNPEKLYLIEVIIATLIPFIWYFLNKIRNGKCGRVLERN